MDDLSTTDIQPIPAPAAFWVSVTLLPDTDTPRNSHIYGDVARYRLLGVRSDEKVFVDTFEVSISELLSAPVPVAAMGEFLIEARRAFDKYLEA
jgi:hypothetical protein